MVPSSAIIKRNRVDLLHNSPFYVLCISTDKINTVVDGVNDCNYTESSPTQRKQKYFYHSYETHQPGEMSRTSRNDTTCNTLLLYYDLITQCVTFVKYGFPNSEDNASNQDSPMFGCNAGYRFETNLIFAWIQFEKNGDCLLTSFFSLCVISLFSLIVSSFAFL